MTKKAFNSLLHKYAAPAQPQAGAGTGPVGMQRTPEQQKKFQDLQNQMRQARQEHSRLVTPEGSLTPDAFMRGAAEGVKAMTQASRIQNSQLRNKAGLGSAQGNYKLVRDPRSQSGYRIEKRTQAQTAQYLKNKMRDLSSMSGIPQNTMRAGAGAATAGAGLAAVTAGAALAASPAGAAVLNNPATRYIGKNLLAPASKELARQTAIELGVQTAGNAHQALLRRQIAAQTDPVKRAQMERNARISADRAKAFLYATRAFTGKGFASRLFGATQAGSTFIPGLQDKDLYFTPQEYKAHPELLAHPQSAQFGRHNVIRSNQLQAQRQNPMSILMRPVTRFRQMPSTVVDPLAVAGAFTNPNAKGTAGDYAFGRYDDVHGIIPAQQAMKATGNRELAASVLSQKPLAEAPKSLFRDPVQIFRAQLSKPQSQRLPEDQLMQLRRQALDSIYLKRAQKKAQSGFFERWAVNAPGKEAQDWLVKPAIKRQAVKRGQDTMSFYKKLSEADPQEQAQMMRQRVMSQGGLNQTREKALNRNWNDQMAAQVAYQVMGNQKTPAQLLPLVKGYAAMAKYKKDHNLQSSPYEQQVGNMIQQRYAQALLQQAGNTQDPIEYAQQLLALKDASGASGQDKYSEGFNKVLIPRIKQQVWKDPFNNMPKAVGLWLASKGMPKGMQNFFGSKGGLYGTIGGLAALAFGAPLLFGLLRRRPHTPPPDDYRFQRMLDLAMQKNNQRLLRQKRGYA